jgi:hypothetical protein
MVKRIASNAHRFKQVRTGNLFDLLGNCWSGSLPEFGERPEGFSTPKKEREREPNPLSVLHTLKNSTHNWLADDAMVIMIPRSEGDDVT